jgi:uncharacterized membrane protein YfcA
MTFDPIAHLALAGLNATMAVLLWHKAVPRYKAARGDWQGACILLLGFILALFSGYAMQLAYDGEPLPWQRGVFALLLPFYGACRLRRALSISDHTWSGPKRQSA